MCVSYPKPVPMQLLACALCVLVAGPIAFGSTIDAEKPLAVVIDQRVIDAAMQRLSERLRQRAAQYPTTPPIDISDSYSASILATRKVQMLRGYDARLTAARSALRVGMIPPADVRRLADERAALQGLALEKLRALLAQVEQLNAQRLERFQEAFGDLPSAARTVSVILMKSGKIDFATPLPEDPLTREVEESRGVRRAYFQFYLNPPNGSPRRHNGFVEFVYDAGSTLWVPTWANDCGEATPLFDAEAFLPLRPYQIVFDGKSFVVSQAQTVRPPDVFALLTPRWTAREAMFAPGPR